MPNARMYLILRNLTLQTAEWADILVFIETIFITLRHMICMTQETLTLSLTPTQCKAARALLAWNQHELAQRAQLGTSTVADFERGKRTPTDANIEAIVSSFTAAGISFADGGVQIAAVSRGIATGANAKRPRLIEATDLNDWAARNDGKQYFPELIGRLIQASLGHVPRQFIFRSGDSTQQAGWDGICEQESNSTLAWLPLGVSGWEFGAQGRDLKKKANEDYETREANSLGLLPSETTFVFATPRRWGQGKKWAEEKNKAKFWKHVMVIDADDLVHWIDLFPQVQQWLGARLNKFIPNTKALTDFWAQWRLSTERPMTPELVFAERDEDGTKLLKWLRDAPSIFELQADSPEEAMAFLYATIDRLPSDHARLQSSRCIIAQTSDAATALGKSSTPLVIVIEASEPGLAASLMAQGHHVLVVYGSQVGTSVLLNTLSRPDAEVFKDALIGMGFDAERAFALTRDSARKLTILRRLIPTTTIASEPDWASGGEAKQVLPLMLAGAWNTNSDGDKKALESLSGKTFAELEALFPSLDAIGDTPLRHAGTTWKLASPFDAWFRLARFLGKTDLERFVEVSKQVLGEKDPRFDMASEERWFAGVRGKAPEYSSWLKSGITETLLLLSMYGDQVASVPSANLYAERVVRDLLSGAGKSRWWSIADELRVLAEVSPDAFMTAIEDSLDHPDQPVMELFKEDEGPVMGRAYHSNLLWALETLAWSTKYLSRAAQILARLAVLDPPGRRYANSPKSSLRSIFLMWLPQTHATLSQRLKVIERLIKVEPTAAWNLMLALLPKSHDIGSNNPKPRWRDFSESEMETVTYSLIDRGTRALTTLLIVHAGVDATRWASFIEHLGSLPPDIRDAAWTKLSETAASITDDEERIRVWTALRRFISHHRSFPDADWALPKAEIDHVETIYQTFSPSDPILQRSWLFDNGVALLTGRNAEKWEERDKELMALQQQAVQELLKDGGMTALCRLVDVAGNPRQAGIAYGLSATPKSAVDETFLASLGGAAPNHRGFVKGIAGARNFEEPDTWASAIVKAAKDKELPEASIVELLLALPSQRTTWDTASSLGESVNASYWKAAHFYTHNLDAEDTQYAISQMIQADRAPEVVENIGAHPETVDAKTILNVLLAATSDPLPTGGNDVVMFQWGTARLFNRLDGDSSVSADEIAWLEWQYLAVLEHSERPAKTLNRFMSSHPQFFVEVLSAVFRASSKEAAANHTPTAQETAVASQAWRLLESWRQLPGADNGEIDGDVLAEWVKEAHRLAVNAERGAIGDEYIGKLLSHAPTGADGVWPHPAVRDVIESMHNSQIESGLMIGVHNNRGVTSRGMLDGGAQERGIAKRYNEWAESTKLEYPRTSAMLREIARSYENHARDFDDEAERNDWRAY
jgi:transcriptional regulator with XRE-family HTH domain